MCTALRYKFVPEPVDAAARGALQSFTTNFCWTKGFASGGSGPPPGFRFATNSPYHSDVGIVAVAAEAALGFAGVGCAASEKVPRRSKPVVGLAASASTLAVIACFAHIPRRGGEDINPPLTKCSFYTTNL